MSQLWVQQSTNRGNIEFVLSTDAYNSTTVKACEDAVEKLLAMGCGKAVVVQQQDRDGDCTKGWNVACAATTGDIIVQVADDIEPPLGWDSSIAELKCEHDGNWWDHDHAVHINDGFGQRMTHAVISRKRYLRYGYFYYPGYKSMFNDTELEEVAVRDGVVIDGRHITIQHHHYSNKHRGQDEVDKLHGGAARWKHGEELFNRRKAAGFPNDITLDASQRIVPVC